MTSGQGTYRGAQFFVLSVSQSGGRRTRTHDFYQQAQSYTEDLGLAPRRFDVRALVIGEAYSDAKDALIDALDEQGPATLTLPLLDDVVVRPDGAYRVSEDTRAMRQATFEMSFVEVFEVDLPIAVTSLADDMQAVSDDVPDALAQDIQERFSVVGAVQNVVDAAVTSVQNAASALRKINGRIAATLGVIADVAQAIDAVSQGAATLISTPARIVADIDAVVISIFRAIDTVQNASKQSVLALTSAGPSAVSREVARLKVKALQDTVYTATLYGDTTRANEHLAVFGFIAPSPAGTDAQVNESATADALKTALARQLCTSATLVDFDTADDVAVYQSDITTLIDALLTRTQDDDAYRIIAQLKATFVQYCIGLQRTLPQYITVTVDAPTTALEVAHRYYGSIDFEADVVLGNNVPNPALILAGTQLRVIGGQA